MPNRILVVDDERDLLELLVKRLNRKGFIAKGVESAEEAIPLLKKDVYDVGIFDIRMKGMDGLELLKIVKEIQPETEIIMLTGHGTIDTAIEAMKRGAYDYLTKPYNLSELEITIQKASEKKKLREKNAGLKQMLHKQDFQIIGTSKKIQQVIQLTYQIADRDVPVLIEGESGTGKELFAKALHYWGYRSKEQFVAVNSGALPETLLESELFGHEKGAFTGAQQQKKGLVEIADGGTLFLDEIGEMPLSVQVKLLRFLESGEFRRVGDVRLRQVNVRVVAATNRNMEEEVREGRFREDLYYRMNVIKLEIPPLRDRLEDIKPLVDHFLVKHQGKELSKEAESRLRSYPFPGNVRELFHILERGCLLSVGNQIKAKDLLLPGMDDTSLQKEDSQKQTHSLEELEKNHIRKVLHEVRWNKTKAAEILGISVRNLYRKIDTYHLKDKAVQKEKL
ncbi:sigma-54 dependent transcriptional regulator [Bacillaceae bacterium S4-13-56]